jgi:hypothetical protein
MGAQLKFTELVKRSHNTPNEQNPIKLISNSWAGFIYILFVHSQSLKIHHFLRNKLSVLLISFRGRQTIQTNINSCHSAECWIFYAEC